MKIMALQYVEKLHNIAIVMEVSISNIFTLGRSNYTFGYVS